tara:strand:- start:1335 stop:1757 length:423 start_codon:yes stop_codon:yes gene_type:complete
MSVRESIAANIVEVLGAMDDPLLKKITRQPFDYERLSNAQFPAVFVQGAEETRGDITLIGIRESSINYQIIGFVKGPDIDTYRNELIEGIENALEVDRTRGGHAKDTQILSVDTDQGATDPIGGITLTVQVRYQYMRGSS